MTKLYQEKEIFFRIAREDDYETIAHIYSHYAANTTFTFHTEALGADEMKSLLPNGEAKYATYVILLEKNIVGYCVLHQYKNRVAYDNTAEISLYFTPEFTGKGLGSEVIKFLEEKARKENFHVLLAGVCDENSASKKLFERNGYRKCANFHQIGRKFGQWLDVIYFEKILAEKIV